MCNISHAMTWQRFTADRLAVTRHDFFYPPFEGRSVKNSWSISLETYMGNISTPGDQDDQPGMIKSPCRYRFIEGYQVAANSAWPYQGETWINIFTKHHFLGAHLALHQEIAGLKKEVEDLRTGKVLTAVTVVKEPDPNPNQKEACTPLGIRFRVNWAMVVHSCSNQYIQ